MGKITYQTLRERVEAIRTKIRKNEYQPGDRIVEQELAAINVSRGPIREALRELENEGIVRYSRNVGCSVRKVTVKELYELYFMRTSYEVLSVKVVNGKIPEATIKRLEQVLNKMQNLTPKIEKCIALDNEFHGELVKMAGFDTLQKMWEELDYVTILGGYPNEGDMAKVAQKQYPSHKRIVDACQKHGLQRNL
ncbi:MAG: GntR family transcriptional regulator [Lachnospiraceae bacterium]